jgi:hypothetical protein
MSPRRLLQAVVALIAVGGAACDDVPGYLPRLGGPDAFWLIEPTDGAVDVELQPTLRWSAAPRAVRYELSLLPTDPALPASPGALASTDTSFVLSEPLEPQVLYHWEVTALDGNGVRSSARAGFGFTTGQGGPPLVLVKPADGAVDVPEWVDFQWLAYPGADDYLLEVAETSTFVMNTLALHIRAVETGPGIMLVPGRQYYWRVGALRSGVRLITSRVFSFIVA